MSLDLSKDFTMSDLLEELKAIWGKNPYSFSTLPPVLKGSTIVEVTCRECGKNWKTQISSLLTYKDTYGYSCKTCKYNGVSSSTGEGHDHGDEPKAAEPAAATQQQPAAEEKAKTDGKKVDKKNDKSKPEPVAPKPVIDKKAIESAIRGKLKEYNDELGYMPIDSCVVSVADDGSFKLTYECVNCGEKQERAFDNLDELKLVELNEIGDKIFPCATCEAEIEKDGELVSMKNHVIDAMTEAGFENVEFPVPLTCRDTVVFGDWRKQQYSFPVADVIGLEGEFQLDNGKFYDASRADESPEAETPNLGESDDLEGDGALGDDDVEETEVGTETPPVVTEDDLFEDDVQETHVDSNDTVEEHHVDSHSTAAHSAAKEWADEGFDDEIVEVTVGSDRASNRIFDSTSYEGAEEGATKKVFNVKEGDFYRSNRYSALLEKHDLLHKFLAKFRDFTNVTYTKLQDEKFYDVPVFKINVPGAPFALVYVDLHDDTLSIIPALVQMIPAATKLPVVVLYSDSVEFRLGITIATMAKIVDYYRNDAKQVRDNVVTLNQSKRYWTAIIDDKAELSRFFETNSMRSTPLPFGPDGLLGLVSIDRSPWTGKQFRAIDRAIRANRAELALDNINWHVPCAIRFITEAPNERFLKYTITDYVEKLDIHVKDGLDMCIAALIKRHYGNPQTAAKGFSIVVEYRRTELNLPSIIERVEKERDAFAMPGGLRGSADNFFISTSDETPWRRKDARYYQTENALRAKFGSDLLRARVNIKDPMAVIRFLKERGISMFQAPPRFEVLVNVMAYIPNMLPMFQKDPRRFYTQYLFGRVDVPSTDGSRLIISKETMKVQSEIARREQMVAFQEFNSEIAVTCKQMKEDGATDAEIAKKTAEEWQRYNLAKWQAAQKAKMEYFEQQRTMAMYSYGMNPYQLMAYQQGLAQQRAAASKQT